MAETRERLPESRDFDHFDRRPTRARVPTQLRVPRGPLARDDRRVGWDEVGDGARRAFDPSTLPD